MNCKPGDMAVVVNYERHYDKVFLGLVVTVVRLVDNVRYPYWVVKEKLPLNGIGKQVDGILDDYLRPIRPGETPEESAEAMRRLHDTTVKEKA